MATDSFGDEDDWLEHQLANDEAFQDRVAESRRQYREEKFRELGELQ